MAGQLDRRRDERGPTALDARRRRHRRCRFGDSILAADPHPLLLHLVHGRLGVHGTRCLHHGQAHAPHGTARQVVHTTRHGLRLQRASHYGHAHHRKPPLATDHDAHIAFYVVLGTPAYLHHDRRHILRRTVALNGARVALRHRHSRGSYRLAPLRFVRNQG